MKKYRFFQAFHFPFTELVLFWFPISEHRFRRHMIKWFAYGTSLDDAIVIFAGARDSVIRDDCDRLFKVEKI